MQENNLPILKFTPIFKSVIWGGTRIAQFKNMPSQGDHVGESWELSPMKGNESVVSEGPFEGRTLNQLMAERGSEIMGERLYARFGQHFPLLIKFIDSTDDLSIQVHPDDALAARRHDSLGKTEMWYSVMPAEGAYLYAGFKSRITPDEFRAKVADNTIVDVLGKYYPVQGICSSCLQDVSTVSAEAILCLRFRKPQTSHTVYTTMTGAMPRAIRDSCI